MSTAIFILVLICILAVVVSLLLGVASMMKGGELNKKYGNKLMIARVSFQGLALFLLALLWILSQ